MATKQTKQSLPRIAIRRGDGLRLTIATAGLLAALVTVFFTTSYMLQSFSASSAAKAALAVQAQLAAEVQMRLDAKARRIGSIVLASNDGGCEEMRFDNLTGAFISIARVDCDTRLIASMPASNDSQKISAGMRSMLQGYKK